MNCTKKITAISLLLLAQLTCLGCAGVSANDAAPAEDAFRWQSAGPGELDLFQGERRVLRYMHAYDTSTEERAHETYKVYHHVFDETGEILLTKGPGGLYTHHRGIFIGWNRLTMDGKEMDFWHMTGVSQRHVSTREMKADANGAVQAVVVHWCDGEGKAVIKEERTIVVRPVEESGLLQLDFESNLTPLLGDVLLNGDPEHAGCQFRPTNAVAEGPAEVKAIYLFHEDGIDPTTDHNLPWVAMSFGLNGKRYHALHLNHPSNPEPTVYSAYRDYGRFGAFPTVEIRRGETLTLQYGYYVGQGDIPERATLQAMYDDYVSRH